ncbi:ethylbenzene dehydrogenase-related protein [Aliidiomarina halalkaliphila]|nr:ethylbenzene dehydrogenase-related protein [Aliidiomarina halalkaliphila]
MMGILGNWRLGKVSGVVALALLTAACAPSTDTDKESAEAQAPLGNQAQTLYVAAEYNDDTFRLHYRLEVENPSWYHQYWRFTDGEWVRMGSGADGPDPHGLYEDRISMMLDDGSVEGFARYGGWMLIHPGMRSLDSAMSSDAVQAHPTLGEAMGRSDVRKYIPQSRNVDRYTDQARWDDVKSEQELDEMRDRGEFLDLWQWRAHRSNPVGYADNGYVLHYRLNSEGRGMYSDNRDAELDRPAYMFDVEKTGIQSLDWDALVAREYSQDDWYYISEDIAVPFDAEHEWQEGDVIPFRMLQIPDGARGAITADGAYRDGAWRVTLERSMRSPNRLDSKRLREGDVYNVAFAVHHGSVGARHHHVSLPHRLGLGVNTGEAEIIATYSETHLADTDLNWYPVELIYPGQVTWEWLTSQHPGAGLIKADIDIKVSDHHGYLPLFQRYIQRHERRLKNTQPPPE